MKITEDRLRADGYTLALVKSNETIPEINLGTYESASIYITPWLVKETKEFKFYFLINIVEDLLGTRHHFPSLDAAQQKFNDIKNHR